MYVLFVGGFKLIKHHPKRRMMDSSTGFCDVFFFGGHEPRKPCKNVGSGGTWRIIPVSK